MSLPHWRSQHWSPAHPPGTPAGQAGPSMRSSAAHPPTSLSPASPGRRPCFRAIHLNQEAKRELSPNISKNSKSACKNHKATLSQNLGEHDTPTFPSISSHLHHLCRDNFDTPMDHPSRKRLLNAYPKHSMGLAYLPTLTPKTTPVCM